MDFGLEQSTIDVGVGVDWFLYGIWVVVGLAILILAVYLVLLFFKKFFASGAAFPAIFQKKIYMLTIPKIFDNDNKESSTDVISKIENFYANLGGLRAQRGFKTWLFGRYDTWSFEVVVGVDGLITFYVAIPVYLKDHIVQQFLSQYPHCQIDEVDDYNIFGAQGFVVAGYLKLIKDKMFPILTYKQMDVDPMVNVLNTISKLPKGQTAAIQFVMRSARGEWRKRGVGVASQMHQGKNLKQAMGGSSGVIPGILGKPSDWIGRKSDAPTKEPIGYKLSPMEEQMAKSIQEKASKAGMDVNIRIVTFGPTEELARDSLKLIANAFAQYSNYEYANGFKATVKGTGRKLITDFIYRHFDEKINCVLNTEEMSSLWHLPLAPIEVPNMRWLQARKLPPPIDIPGEGITLGENFYRGQQKLIKIKDRDRQRHMYIIGMTGTGKSVFQANLAIQDIVNGKGVCIVDPHGSLIDDYILPYIPKDRLEDVIYFDPSDIERPIGLNMLEATSQHEMDFAVGEMIAIFYKLLPDPSMAGPMFEHYMRNALLALMADRENPGTLVELGRIFTDADFRADKLKHVTDALVKDFWEREYPASQRGSSGADMISYVVSKTGRFVENEMMRNIIGQSKSGINFRQIMDEGKILLLNLSKGKMGEMNSNLLGLIAVSKLQMAAMARADMAEEKRKDFYLYIDEFQNFITDSVSTILAEARKYKLNLIMAHQYIAQLIQHGESKVKDAVFGNVGNIVCFRIGVDDSEVIAKQLAPKVNDYDLLNVEKFNAYIRLLIDNTASDTFNIHCFPLPDNANRDMAAGIKEYCRTKYGRNRQLVMKEVLERSRIGMMGKPPMAGSLKV